MDEPDRPDAPVPAAASTRRLWLIGPRGLAALAALAVLALGGVFAEFGVAGAMAAVGLAIVPLPLFIAITLWMDPFEPEPRSLLAIAFLWGASAAIVVSGIANGLADAFVGELFGSLVSAPVVEEVSKGFILVVFYLARPDEFDGVVDGIVYAVMTALGFAFMENIDYYGRALLRDGPAALAAVFVLRAGVAAFAHPLFTSMTGVGLGLARQFPQPGLKALAPAAGLAAAVGLHLMWNSGTALGIFFFVIYALVMLPGVAVLLALVGFFLRGEGRVIRLQLLQEVEAGLLTPADLACLGSVRGRLRASYAAWSTGGRKSWAARRRFHQAASELAFLRERAARDQAPADPAQEAPLVARLRLGPAAVALRPPPPGEPGAGFS